MSDALAKEGQALGVHVTECCPERLERSVLTKVPRLLPSRDPILFGAGGKCLFLLGRLEFRQQERMSDAGLLAQKASMTKGTSAVSLKRAAM